jgi:hypothetical protein
MKYLGEATKNTSPLPALLSEARTSEEMDKVLRIIKEEGNEDIARRLSKAILESNTADDVADAFGKIAEEAASAGVQDPEELLKIKLDSSAKKFVTKA